MSCKHCSKELVKNDRYYVNSKEHNNCCLCLVDDKGPLTQQEVARLLWNNKNACVPVGKGSVN